MLSVATARTFIQYNCFIFSYFFNPICIILQKSGFTWDKRMPKSYLKVNLHTLYVLTCFFWKKFCNFFQKYEDILVIVSYYDQSNIQSQYFYQRKSLHSFFILEVPILSVYKHSEIVLSLHSIHTLQTAKIFEFFL